MLYAILIIVEQVVVIKLPSLQYGMYSIYTSFPFDCIVELFAVLVAWSLDYMPNGNEKEKSRVC